MAVGVARHALLQHKIEQLAHEAARLEAAHASRGWEDTSLKARAKEEEDLARQGRQTLGAGSAHYEP